MNKITILYKRNYIKHFEFDPAEIFDPVTGTPVLPPVIRVVEKPVFQLDIQMDKNGLPDAVDKLIHLKPRDQEDFADSHPNDYFKIGIGEHIYRCYDFNVYEEDLNALILACEITGVEIKNEEIKNELPN